MDGSLNIPCGLPRRMFNDSKNRSMKNDLPEFADMAEFGTFFYEK